MAKPALEAVMNFYNLNQIIEKSKVSEQTVNRPGFTPTGQPKPAAGAPKPPAAPAGAPKPPAAPAGAPKPPAAPAQGIKMKYPPLKFEPEGAQYAPQQGQEGQEGQGTTPKTALGQRLKSLAGQANFQSSKDDLDAFGNAKGLQPFDSNNIVLIRRYTDEMKAAGLSNQDIGVLVAKANK